MYFEKKVSPVCSIWWSA